MAVSTSYSPITVSWSSTNQAIPVTFPFLTGTLVVTEVSSTGVETVKSLTTHYTVSGGTDSNGLPATGTVTMVGSATSGSSLRITRTTPKTQATAFTAGGAFPAKSVEAVADKLTLISQEMLAGTAADEITGDVMQLNSAGATDYWDAEDHIIRNVIDGVEDDDAVNKSQLDAMAAGDTTFTQSGTGAVSRTWQAKLRDTVCVLDFIPVAEHAAIAAYTSTTDVVTYIDSAIVAARGRSLYFPAGRYKIGSQISVNPAYNYRFFGDNYGNTSGSGSNPTAAGTVIWNANTSSGHGIVIDDTANAGADNAIVIEDISVIGNGTSGDGLRFINLHGLELHRVRSYANGGHGIYMEKCFNSKAMRCIAAQNLKNGWLFYQENNNVTLINCFGNGNARLSNAGWGGIKFDGTSGYENLGVTLIGCDATGNGEEPGITVSYGIVLQYVHSGVVLGCYCEGADTAIVYADNTSRNLTFIGNRFQDGAVTLDSVPGLLFQSNRVAGVNGTGALNITVANGDDARVSQTTFTGTTTTSYSGKILAPKQQWDTAAPVAGTWTKGDYVHNSNPASGSAIGWVCTVSGTPGTWVAEYGPGLGPTDSPTFESIKLNDSDDSHQATVAIGSNLTAARTITVTLPDAATALNLINPPRGMHGYITNRYYAGEFSTPQTTNTLAISSNTLYAMLFPVGMRTTFTRIAIDVTATAVGNARLGIYAADGTGGVPGTLVLDAGTVSVDTSTGVKQVTISQTLDPGFYWTTVVSDVTPTLRAILNTNGPYVASVGVAAPGTGDTQYSIAHTYGALPTPFGSGSWAAANIPMVMLRVV